ncbi:SpoIIE family protein phosphatase [Streptomyces sp. MUM 203J]|uniref:ATP-binding SpoIIE family protein phosphatase n=1 Tax=Streptomyces sp. MUM 203J TaxID=2791990 RepID=UPI001F037C32|nr:SpoIIE family protein phosphatase [Streptomyces sp. MUM 203J]MCH0543032.1 SpoIIE family protein phosphatase [Streptomyces sp. MUM 203J]
MDRGAPQEEPERFPEAGRVPLAVVVVDCDGRVSHWSTGARRLFGPDRAEAVGRPADELLPISGILDEDGTDDPYGQWHPQAPATRRPAGPGGPVPYGAGRTPAVPPARTAPDHVTGPGPEAVPEAQAHSRLRDRPGPGPEPEPFPAAGRARLPGPGEDRTDVLWWAYPLTAPGPERLLVLAADAARYGGDLDVAPGFALHTEFEGFEELARRLPEILPSMSVGEATRIVGQVLELGYPVLEFSQCDRVPVTPDWGVPRRADRRPRPAAHDPHQQPAPVRTAPPAPAVHDLEYAAVRERLEFLNEVSSQIGSSLDLARTIHEVSAAVVPRFTDVAGTYLREQVVAGEGFPDGPPDATTMWHRVAVEHVDEPGRWDDVIPVGEAMPFPVHTPFFQCMTSGEPVLVPRISEQAGTAIAAQFEKRDIRPLITGRSMLVVPLKARNVVLGFMILLRHPGRAPFDDMDRVTGAELAARAGLVLDNARMYTYQENVAETLQDSMLPQVPARLPGCDVATRYLPGTLLGRVGGDWFDTIRLPGSRTALVVGDVMGHGINSAAMMGQLRTAVQTMAGLDVPPAQLLRKLDDLAQRLGDNYLATCLYVVYDPVRGELALANAGHVPPVLVRARDGRSELLDLPSGAPIGVGGVPFTAVRVSVEPGDRLVMCTDGLVEMRGEDIGVGLATLCESAAHPAASMDDACDTIIRTLARRGGRKDDVALLMARLTGIDAPDVARRRLDPVPRSVREARALARERLADWGLDELTDTLELLVSEVVTNAVRHSGGSRPVDLRLVRTDSLLCEVTDGGRDLPELRDAGPDDEEGRGLRVVNALAREWGAGRSADGTTSVWFELSLPRKRTGGNRT